MAKFGKQGTLAAQEGKGDQLQAILLRAADIMKQVEGCHLYLVSRVAETDTVSATEVWDSAEQHQNSFSTPGVADLIQEAMPLLAGLPQQGPNLDVLGGHGLSWK